MNSVTFRGPEAEIRWGYLPAAVLGPWTLAGETLTATVVSHDTFRTQQPSLTFRVNRQNSPPWTWTVTTLHIANGTLTASVRSQE